MLVGPKATASAPVNPLPETPTAVMPPVGPLFGFSPVTTGGSDDGVRLGHSPLIWATNPSDWPGACWRSYALSVVGKSEESVTPVRSTAPLGASATPAA